MSDEEIKAIKTFKKGYGLTKAETEIISNLIEKQQKEIEELKEVGIRKDELIANFSTRHFQDREKIRNSIGKDKIREKIKELEKIKNTEVNIFSHDFLTLERTIKVLQDLLKEE